MSGGDQRRRNENQNFVLQHVGGEELLAELMNGRSERERKRRPSGRKARMAPSQTEKITTAKRADGVYGKQRGKGRNDCRLPAPWFGPDRLDARGEEHVRAELGKCAHFSRTDEA